MKKLLLVVVLGGTSWLLWSGAEATDPTVEPSQPGVEVEAIPLDIHVGGADEVVNAAGQHSEQGTAHASLSAESLVVVAGIQSLDRWHREGSRWVAVAEDQPFVRALSDFGGLWKGKATTYQASLRAVLPGSFGGDFDGYAEAFAMGNIQGLSAAIHGADFKGPAWVAWADALFQLALAERQYALAGDVLGKNLRQMLKSGYDRKRILDFVGAASTIRSTCRNTLPHRTYIVEGGDSLDRICRKFAKEGMQLSYGWLNDFNGRAVRTTNLRQGQELRLPEDPLHVEAWTEERLLVVYAGENTPIAIYEASFGKDGEATPLGEFTLDVFLKEPVFWQQEGDPVPFGNPENPLGTRWMGFKEAPSYGIHGNTNAEESIGSFESLGCIRMRNGEVEELFELLTRGVRVTVTN